MSQLAKLRTDLLSLSHEQLLEKIREIRDDRKITKSGVPKTVEKKSKAKKAITGLLDALSPEDKAALLASLEGDV